MPENWKTYLVSDFIDINPKIPLKKGEEYSFVEMKDLDPNNKYVSPSVSKELKGGARFQNGDTLFARITPCLENGKICQVKDLENNLGFGSTEFLVFRGKRNISDSDFIFYLSRTNFFRRFSEGKMIGTSGRQRVAKDAFENLELLLPSVSEQKSIAAILSALDDKIELNLQMNKTLEEMAMVLYKHWFVDFGPFQDREFVESELGEIPKGWEVKTLGDLFKLKHGFAFKGKHFQLEEREELLLTPGNFQASGGIKFNWGKQKFYSAEFPNDYILTKGDLIIALTDLTQSCDILGAPAIIPDNDYKYLHNQRLGLVTNLLPQFSNDFIYCICNSRDFRSFIRNSKTGSTVSHTSPTRIYDYKIALPPQGLEINFREELKNLLELTFTNSSENKTLIQLRDTLLPKLISGEVRVKDVEKTLSEVL